MTVKKTVYKCDRRELLKFAAYGSVATAALCNFDQLHAAGQCEKIEDTHDIKKQFGATSAAGGEFFYWIDGAFTSHIGANMLARAKLCVALDLPHTAASYVEAVILSDSSGKLIASQRFEVASATSKGKVPYAVFDNLNLDPTKPYTVHYILRTSVTAVTVYKFEIAKEGICPSRLDYAHLSPSARAKIAPALIARMEEGNHSFGPGKPGFGYITSPYLHSAGMPTHTCRAELREFRSDLDAFKIYVHEMHTDAGASHYMRHFLVLDPVGRLLGGLYRTSDADTSGLVAGAATRTFAVTNTLSPGFGAAGALDTTSTLSIKDCPFVQVIIEDKADAIARLTIRLR